MKRTLKYALSAVLVSAIAGSAFAQTNFPDVPDNHWAFEALARMKKEGLLIGYPDGQFKGPRVATRYEMAVAVHAAWLNLKNQTDGLATQIKSIEDKMGGGSGGDFANLKAAVDQMKADMAGMKSWGDDIASLKKMAATFEPELKQLMVDTEKMKASLNDLSDRVTKLEKAKLPVNISGDVNFVALGGYSTNGTNGLTVDGRPTGVGRGATAGNKVGAFRDLSVIHEVGLTLNSNNESGPKWGGTIVYGNAVGAGKGFGSQSLGAGGAAFSEGPASVYIQNLWVKFDTSLASLALNATVGRIGYQIDPYIYKRQDVTPYYANSRWDNGDWSFDGFNIGFNFGKTAKVNVLVGRTGDTAGGGATTTGGQTLQPLTAGRTTTVASGSNIGAIAAGPTAGALLISQQAGINANFGLSDKGTVNLSYLWLSSNAGTGGTGNQVDVYGATFNGQAKQFGINAGYSKSDVSFNKTKIVNKNDDAYWVKVKADGNKFGGSVGYRYIAPLFGAPGDWGRIGTWWNPTDIKGVLADVHFDATPALRLSAAGGAYTGTGKALNGNQAGQAVFSTKDKVNHVIIGGDYKVGPAYDVNLSYEQATFQSAATGLKPTEKWFNIGLGWGFGDSAKLNFLWQISEVDPKAVAKSKGGLITTQFSVKF